MDRKHDHPRLDLIEYTGETKVRIAGMDIPHTITDLDLGRKDKTGKIKTETDTELRTPIILFYLHKVFSFFSTGITGHVDRSGNTNDRIHAEVADTITL